MRVALYFRVSTKGQGDADHYGLPKQRGDVATFVEREGHEVIAEFEDIGYSGARVDRPGLAQLLEAQGVEAVVVPAWDHLARDVTLDGYLRHVLERRGVRVLSATQSNDVDPTARLTQGILAAVAGFERHLIAARLAGARKVKASRGGYAHGRPRFGTQAIGKALAVNDAETVTLAEMKALRGLGLTIREIAETLNARGYETRTGTPWGPSSVYRILQRA